MYLKIICLPLNLQVIVTKTLSFFDQALDCETIWILSIKVNLFTSQPRCFYEFE